MTETDYDLKEGLLSKERYRYMNPQECRKDLQKCLGWLKQQGVLEDLNRFHDLLLRNSGIAAYDGRLTGHLLFVKIWKSNKGNPCQACTYIALVELLTITRAWENQYNRLKVPEEESQLRRMIATQLWTQGWKVQENASLRCGSVDIKATKDNSVLLVEVKSSAGHNDVAHAVGQLLSYRCQISESDPQLAVGLPKYPAFQVQALLDRYGINVIVLEGACLKPEGDTNE